MRYREKLFWGVGVIFNGFSEKGGVICWTSEALFFLWKGAEKLKETFDRKSLLMDEQGVID